MFKTTLLQIYLKSDSSSLQVQHSQFKRQMLNKYDSEVVTPCVNKVIINVICRSASFPLSHFPQFSPPSCASDTFIQPHSSPISSFTVAISAVTLMKQCSASLTVRQSPKTNYCAAQQQYLLPLLQLSSPLRLK